MSGSDKLFDVSGQVCVITGASTGLGFFLAEQLVERGATVIGISRNPPKSHSTSTQLIHMIGDVTDYDAMEAMLETTEAEHGPVTSFINNAGIADHAKPGAMNADVFRGILETNTIAPAVLTDLVAAKMAKSGIAGSIVNISSALAHRGMPRLASYGASKAALEAMTRQQAIHWGKSGIRINAFAPGWFFSEMTNESLNQGFEPVLRGMTPMRRVGTVQDMIGGIVFLLSSASQFVTGSTICADGGYSSS